MTYFNPSSIFKALSLVTEMRGNDLYKALDGGEFPPNITTGDNTGYFIDVFIGDRNGKNKLKFRLNHNDSDIYKIYGKAIRVVARETGIYINVFNPLTLLLISEHEYVRDSEGNLIQGNGIGYNEWDTFRSPSTLTTTPINLIESMLGIKNLYACLDSPGYRGKVTTVNKTKGTEPTALIRLEVEHYSRTALVMVLHHNDPDLIDALGTLSRVVATKRHVSTVKVHPDTLEEMYRRVYIDIDGAYTAIKE